MDTEPAGSSKRRPFWKNLRSMPGREPMLAPACAAIAGVLIVDRWDAQLGGWTLWIALILTILLVLCLTKRTGLGNIALLLFIASGFGLLHQLRLRTSEQIPFKEVIEKNGFKEVELQGVVDDEPRELTVRAGSSFPVALHWMGDGISRKASSVRVQVILHGQIPEYGDLLHVKGLLRSPRPARNPGEFDLRDHLQRQGILAEVRVRESGLLEVVAKGKGNPIRASALRSRDSLAETVTRGLEDSPDVQAVIRAMTLGTREINGSEMEDSFRLSGTLHIFAVSGLHVGILALIGGTLLRLLGLPKRWAFLFVIPLLVYYAFITGLRPSAVRATVMASVLLAGFALQLRPRLLNTLAFSAFAFLLYDTRQLFLPGFQLSFAVLFSIALFGGRFHSWFQKMSPVDPFLPLKLYTRMDKVHARANRYLAGMMSVSLAAWIGSAFLIGKYFGITTPVAILANCLLVPLAFCVLSLAALSMGSSLVGFTFGSTLINKLNWLAASLTIYTATGFSRLPGGHIAIPRLNPPPCQITVLELRNGAGCQHVLMDNGDNWLIDSGPGDAFGTSIKPFLLHCGVTEVNALFLTHGDKRHVGATLKIMEEFGGPEVYHSGIATRSPAMREIQTQLEERDLRTEHLYSPNHVNLGDKGELRVLYPPAGHGEATANDNCLVLQLIVEGWRILFLSDAGFVAEQHLLEAGINLRSDVLIKGNHSDDFSATPSFLKAVSPHVVIATNGRRSDHEHIDERLRRELAKRKIELFDQSESGAVTLNIHRDELELSGFLDGRKIVLTAR